MARRTHGEGCRSKEGRYFRWELRIGKTRIVRKDRTRSGLDRKIQEALSTLRVQGYVQGDATKVFFGEAFEFWLNSEIEPKCSPRTLESYDSVYRNHLSGLTTKALLQIAPEHLQAISNHLSLLSKRRMAAYAVTVCSRFFNWCIKRQLMSTNPALLVETVGSSPPLTRVMDDDEATMLMNEARLRFEAGHFRCYPVLHFCLNTGVRISEALALRQSDVVRSSGDLIANIRWQIYHYQQAWQFRPVKCNSERTIALNVEARAAIAAAQMQSYRDRRKAKSAYLENELVFPNEIGEPMLRCVPYLAFVRLQRSLGIECPYTVHELRHTFLSHIARVSPLQVAKAIAGHSTLRTTERYIHAFDEDVRTAMSIVTLGSGDTTPNSTPKRPKG